MKYCTHCGAGTSADTVSFCATCGKEFPAVPEGNVPQSGRQNIQAGRGQSAKQKRNPKKKKEKKNKKPQEHLPEIEGEPIDDGYDGYYNDVLPPDTDRINEGMDKELVKKVVALGISVTLIILMCVGILYIL